MSGRLARAARLLTHNRHGTHAPRSSACTTDARLTGHGRSSRRRRRITSFASFASRPWPCRSTPTGARRAAMPKTCCRRSPIPRSRVCPSCGADGVRQAGHRRRLPAEGLGLVRRPTSRAAATAEAPTPVAAKTDAGGAEPACLTGADTGERSEPPAQIRHGARRRRLAGTTRSRAARRRAPVEARQRPPAPAPRADARDCANGLLA